MADDQLPGWGSILGLCHQSSATSVMDSLIILPLAAFATILVPLACLLLFLPRSWSLSLSQMIAKANNNGKLLFVPSAILGGVVFISIFQLYATSWHSHGVMETVDRMRAESSLALALLDLLLISLVPALCEERRQGASMLINLEAMKRQVKGLQAEYERVTSSANPAPAPAPPAKPSGGGGGFDVGEEWRRKVEELTVEREEQKALLDAAVRAKSTAEAKTEALLSQVKGYDREFDRLLDENKALKAAAAGGGARVSVASMVGQRPNYTVKKDA